METIHGLTAFGKTVISEHIRHGNAFYIGTDTTFLTILQKMGKPSERLSLMITRMCNLAKNGCGGDMLKNL